MPTYLQVADLAPVTPPGITVEAVDWWIVKAETRLAARLAARGCTLATVASDPAILDTVKDVLGNAVLRVLRNPGGVRSESEGTYSVTLNPLDSAGNVWFPDEDLALLCPGAGSRKVGTIPLKLPAIRGWVK